MDPQDRTLETTPMPARFRAAIEAALDAWTAALGEELVSVVLFGSVARGAARDDSDIDVLVVADEFPRSLHARRKVLLDAWARVQSARGLPYVEWNLVTKTTVEAREHSPLYLDMVEDAILLRDRDQFFERILQAMRDRMRELGSRRVYLDDGSWYWDLYPAFRFGDVVRI